MNHGSTSFSDPELLELLGDESQLLAIADAVAATAQSTSRPSAGGTSRRAPRRFLSLLGVALVLAALAAAPALALSATMRELVGLTTKPPSRPPLVATVTDLSVHGPHLRPGTPITVTFTVGERGKPPGTGVPRDSVFLVLLVTNAGPPRQLATASGNAGRYRVTTRLGPGSGIRRIQIGGWLNDRTGSPANKGFWLPVTIVDNSL